MEGKTQTEEKHVNYLVTSYEDLRDVVTAVEQMIANNEEVRDEPTLRKSMLLDVIPLKDKAGSIIKIQLHDAMTVRTG